MTDRSTLILCNIESFPVAIGAGDGRDLALEIIADGRSMSEFALYNTRVAKKVSSCDIKFNVLRNK